MSKVGKLASSRKKALAKGKYRKAARKQNKINKKMGSKVKHTKKSIKKYSPKNQAAFKKASASAKKSGTSISYGCGLRSELSQPNL
jgi:hypothetical protein